MGAGGGANLVCEGDYFYEYGVKKYHILGLREEMISIIIKILLYIFHFYKQKI